MQDCTAVPTDVSISSPLIREVRCCIRTGRPALPNEARQHSEMSASRSGHFRCPTIASVIRRNPSSPRVLRPCPTAQAPGCTVHRYYDPTTGQFLTVDPLVSITGQPFGYANDDPVNGSDPSGDSGNEVDLMCSGGGYHPGESVAQACAYAEANAKQVTSSECSNDGSCGNSGCGKFGIKCWYPLIPFAVVLCVAGGCEAALGAIGAGTAATAIVDACAATGGECTAAGLYLASKAAEGQAEADANACSNPYEKAFYQGVANSIQDVDLTHLAKELSEL